MKRVLKIGWSLVAIGFLAALWHFVLTLGISTPLALFASVAVMGGVTLIAAYAVWWMWFQEG